MKIIVDQAPLDVLRSAEVRFDRSAQLRELQSLGGGHRRLALSRGLDAFCCVPPVGEA